jgi:hypothetical protein
MTPRRQIEKHVQRNSGGITAFQATPTVRSITADETRDLGLRKVEGRPDLPQPGRKFFRKTAFFCPQGAPPSRQNNFSGFSDFCIDTLPIACMLMQA